MKYSIFPTLSPLGFDYKILLGEHEILSSSVGFIAVLKTFHRLYPTITCEKFHPGKVGSLFITNGTLLLWVKIFQCNHISLLYQDEKRIQSMLTKEI